MKSSKSRLIIAVIFVLVVAAYLVNSLVLEKSRRTKIVPRVERTEPAFVKEGTLSFINTEGDTIRTIDIEIADQERERMQGLMYRTNMGYDRGMLFVFDVEEEQSFWMKNTKISLDILYVNSDLEIVSLYKHTQPYSESPIPSFEPALYVVEVVAGFCERFDVAEGDRISYDKL